MLDPLYSLRPKRGRHSFRARDRDTEKRHITVRRNDLPGIAAHTAAGGPKRARNVVTSTGLELRKRIPLARSARSAPRLCPKHPAARYPVPCGAPCYLISTLAPASSNFFLMAAASSLFTPSLTVLGAPSTRSLASFRPRLVTSRTALMTLILLPPTSVSTTENSVFSSAGAAPPAAAPPPAATTVAAAAETPKVSSIFFTRSDASNSVSPLISSRIVSTFDMTLLLLSILEIEPTGLLREPVQQLVLHWPRRTQTCWP